MLKGLWVWVWTPMVLFMVPTQALAYIGPGAGLGAIGTVLAVIGVVLLAVVGFLWYPLKRVLKRSRPTADQSREKGEADGA